MFKILHCIGLLWLFSCSCWAENAKQQQQLNPQRFRRQANKLHITLLYSSLCPDSRSFMKQLGPAYEHFKDYIDVKLVPFGKAKSFLLGSTFLCQHGPDECIGNTLHNCIIKRIPDQATQVRFVACQMLASEFNDIKRCVQQADVKDIEDDAFACVENNEGVTLQLEAENITKYFNPAFIPTIIYNHVFNQQLQDASIRDFADTICLLLQQNQLIDANDKIC